MKRLLIIFMLIATPCYAQITAIDITIDKASIYWVLIKKQGKSVIVDGKKPSFDKGDVIYVLKDTGQSIDDFSWNERQNNKIVKMKLTQLELNKLIEPESVIEEDIITKEPREEVYQYRKYKFDVDNITEKESEEIIDVETTITSLDVKPVVYSITTTK